MNRRIGSQGAAATASVRCDITRWQQRVALATCLWGLVLSCMARAAPDEPMLEAVVVTAQRVESDLQQTPVAVTALSETVLAERNITNLLDLSSISPGLQIGSRSGGDTALGAVTIRGMGTNASPPGAPAVGLYIDEVYYPSAFGNLLGVFDVDNIEVLRGPQGTLFGRNTIGGALLFSSKQPELGKFDGYAEATGGNQGEADAQGAVNLPVGDKVAVRLSGGLTNEAGYVHDDLNALNRGSEHDRQARLQVVAAVTDQFSINFKLEDLELRNNGPASIVTGFNYNSTFGHPFAPNGLNQFISPGWYEDAGFNSPSFFNARFRIAELTAKYDISDNVTFKSISAYSVTNSNLQLDQDYTPVNILGVSRGIVRDELFTQEFRMSGNTFGRRLHWSGGVYFYGEHNNNCCESSEIFGMPSNPFGNYVINTQSYSAYGQASYDITSQLALVAGARYTDEQVATNDEAIPPLLFPYSQKASFTNTSPLVGLNLQLDKDLLVYLKASQGFRAGGFSPTVVSGNTYNPETAKTYEGGMRWEVLDHRLRINPTLYYTLWDDIQFNSVGFCTCFPGPLPFIKNAGSAEVKGVELELEAALTDQLLLAGSYSYIDSHYTSIAPFLAMTNSLQQDTPLEHAPRNAFFLGPTYTQPLPGDFKLIGNLSYAWQSRQRSSTSNADNVEISPYGLLNARLTFQAPGDRWSLALWSKNLTDKRYAFGGTDFGTAAIPTTEVDVGRPREYGATGRYNF